MSKHVLPMPPASLTVAILFVYRLSLGWAGPDHSSLRRERAGGHHQQHCQHRQPHRATEQRHHQAGLSTLPGRAQ